MLQTLCLAVVGINVNRQVPWLLQLLGPFKLQQDLCDIWVLPRHLLKGCAPPACLTAIDVHEYTSNITNATYMLNTNASDSHTAEAFCTARGAHLVAYASLEEQIEVGEHIGAAKSSGCI
jgi:hypothetical protein